MATANGPDILVVEDDPDLADVVVQALSLEGLEVRHASDGRAALDCCAARMPKLILLDMKMPVMDGWEFARHFHEKYGAPSPIIVVTAAESAAQRCRDIAADGWLAKPFELEALRTVVREKLPDPRAGA